MTTRETPEDFPPATGPLDPEPGPDVVAPTDPDATPETGSDQDTELVEPEETGS